MVSIELSEYELMQGAVAGAMRVVDNVIHQRKPRWGQTPDGMWQTHIEAALAEQARAKVHGVYWPGKGRRDLPDAADGADVRHTELATGCLLLHPEDPDDRLFWLLTGRYGRYILRGCILGRDGKQQRWWRTDTGRPCFFVPQVALMEPPP